MKRDVHSNILMKNWSASLYMYVVNYVVLSFPWSKWFEKYTCTFDSRTINSKSIFIEMGILCTYIPQ